jgi:diguanylate cyclase (GGDEF)-like protein/PAS domain S-box-containing protein
MQAERERDLLLQFAGVGIVYVRQRMLLRCNERYAEIFGYGDPRDIQGCSALEIYPSEADYKQLGAEAYPRLAEGGSYKSERLMRRRGGQLFWCSLTGRLIDPAHPEAGSIWIVDDIDDRKRAEAGLAQLMLEQQLIFDHAMVGIVFLKDRRVTRCNRAFEQLFGYAPGELNGLSSRSWYLDDAGWEQAGRDCYAPFREGRAFQGEMVLARKDGSPVHCEVRSKAIDPSDLSQGSIWITMDISARKQAEAAVLRAKAELEALVQERTQQLSQTVQALEDKIREQHAAEARIQSLAHFDALTGLPNRLLLRERAEQALEIARRQGHHLALMFLDLDHFKRVNDSLGHRVGDVLLRQLAQRLRSALREPDTVARLGGDEFVLVLPDTDAGGAARVARKLLGLCTDPFVVEQHELNTSPSIGIALFPEDGQDFDTLCASADVAMYRAKRDGRNAARFFTAEMQAQTLRALTLENALRRALERGQLHLCYQPQVELAQGRITGAEALLRWEHPELGSVSPTEFIPVAESCGLILPMGEWVIREVAGQIRQWMEQGLGPVKVAVNLSSVQFRHLELPQLIGQIVEQAGIDPALLELELTEGMAMLEPQRAIETMRELHRRGLQLAMDDFGTGYSSLSYLKKFPVYKLKIDQSFVRDLTEDPEDRAIVAAIISMAASLGLQTLAEGVETQGQLDILRQQGCREAQGWLFGRPLRAPEFAALLAAQRADRC